MPGDESSAGDALRQARVERIHGGHVERALLLLLPDRVVVESGFSRDAELCASAAAAEQEFERQLRSYVEERGFHETGTPSPWRHFERSQGEREAFWSIRLVGSESVTHFGRMGQGGATRRTRHGSPDQAARALERAVAAKLRAGYLERAIADAAGDDVPPRIADDHIEQMWARDVEYRGGAEQPAQEWLAPLAPELALAIRALFDEALPELQRRAAIPDSRFDVEAALAFVAGEVRAGLCLDLHGAEVREAVTRCLRFPSLELGQAVRLLALVGPDPRRVDMLEFVEEPLTLWRDGHGKRATLLELERAMLSLGVPSGAFAEAVLRGPELRFARWGADACAPFLLSHVALLERALHWSHAAAARTYETYRRNDSRRAAFEALALLPALPSSVVEAVWAAALGGAVHDRPRARRCLERAPDREARLLATLAGDDPALARSAAEWLAELGVGAAAPRILELARSERGAKERARLLAAAERLGADVDAFADPAGVAAEAERVLARPLPESLAGFPFDGLPALRWSDGTPVEPQLPRAWLIEAASRKQSAPDPVLRRRTAALDPASRTALARFVFEAWRARDAVPTEAKVQAYAVERATFQIGMRRLTSRRLREPVTDAEVEELARALVEQVRPEVQGSALPEKGVLAVVGACAGGELVPEIERYVRENSGWRFGQSKALVEMAAWIDDPAATQFVAWAAERCRTRGIRNAARAVLAERARRGGQSSDALADAGIPTADLAADGTRMLDAGARQLLARLGDDLELALFDSEGARLRAFPKPRAGDDPEPFAAAKAGFAAAKKTVRDVVRAQRARLREALLGDRDWPLAEWQLLRAHPVVGRLMGRLLWCEARGVPARACFRPGADGALRGPSGETIALAETARVRLAHGAVLAPDVRLAWLGALEASGDALLFPQLRTLPLPLEDAAPELTEIADFAGRRCDGRKLLGSTRTLGWERSEAQDGGFYFEFRRPVTRLGLVAVLAFSGQGLFEPRPSVELGSLCFRRLDEKGRPDEGSPSVPLAEVPRVLLCEAWHEASEIADTSA